MERHDQATLLPEKAFFPRPWLRIQTFGRFQIAWVDPQTGQRTPLPAERFHG